MGRVGIREDLRAVMGLLGPVGRVVVLSVLAFTVAALIAGGALFASSLRDRVTITDILPARMRVPGESTLPLIVRVEDATGAPVASVTLDQGPGCLFLRWGPEGGVAVLVDTGGGSCGAGQVEETLLPPGPPPARR